jgi:hypothetical protein
VEPGPDSAARGPSDRSATPPDGRDSTRFVVAPFGRSWEHWILLAAGLGGLLVLVVLGVFVDPDPRGFGTHERLGLPACKPMEWWNIPCPGCGVTTSVALAAHGRIWASIRNQPFGFLVALMLPVFAAWCLWHAARGRDLNNAVHGIRVGRWGVLLVAFMTAAWIYKLALVRHWFG